MIGIKRLKAILKSPETACRKEALVLQEFTYISEEFYLYIADESDLTPFLTSSPFLIHNSMF